MIKSTRLPIIGRRLAIRRAEAAYRAARLSALLEENRRRMAEIEALRECPRCKDMKRPGSDCDAMGVTS